MACQKDESTDGLFRKQGQRPAHGRLSELDDHRPFLVKHASRPFFGEIADAKHAARLRQEIDRELTTNLSADPLRHGAYLDVAIGRYGRAVARLEELRWLAGDDAPILSDLAAVLLEWALSEDRPLELLEALRFSSRAAAEGPQCTDCLFNHALILSHLHLRRRAAAAWHRLLAMEHDAGWRAEAESWLVRLEDDSYEKDLVKARRDLLSPGSINDEVLRHWVATLPQEVRVLAEENLLGVWAKASREGDTLAAEAALKQAESVGRGLAGRGSWLLADAVDRIHSGPEPGLIRGHELFSRGMQAYHDGDFHHAESLLSAAVAALETGGSVYAEVASLYRAICVYYRDVDAARPLFESLLGRVSPQRHPTLTARTLWMLGILDMVQRRTGLAFKRFHRMHSLLEKGAGSDRAAIANTMLAETLELRGEVERGWRYRLRALPHLAYRTDLRRRHSALLEASQALGRRGDAELALIFLDEVTANAARWGQPLGEAEAYSARARAKMLLGDVPGACDDAQAALNAVERMPPGALRDRTGSLTRLYLGMAWAEEDPARGLQIMQQAHETLEAGGWSEERLVYLERRARALLAMGERDSGRKTLLASVQEIENLRTQADNTMSRLEILRHAQSTHEQLIHLSLSRDAATSFDQAERARARELVASSGRGGSPAQRVLAELPATEVLVLFTALSESLFAWVVEDGRLTRHDLGVERSELQRLTDLFLDALRAQDNPIALRAGARLYASLIEPLAIRLAPGRRLVLVPDLMLAEVPFVAFFDAAAGRFLIEKMPVVQTPSVELYLDAAARRSRETDRPTSALVVGEANLTGSSFDYLPGLPRARQEAELISSLYPQSRLLLGDDARPERLLAKLPTVEIFHFAGHAFASGPSLDDSFLLLTPNTEGRARLSAGEIRQLDLARLRLAVLAACHSAEGVRKGREGAASLAGAFLAAGVPTVVAARWDVDDHRSYYLMTRLHEYLARGENAASAYRRVVLDLLAGDDTECKEPGYWGVFAVLGT